MNELALFAGGGGGILGGKLLGWRTVCAVERNAYCARRLMQRQNEGHIPPFPIWDDVCTFDGTPWRGVVDVVSGGFPCQDISAAGKGAGLDGERSGLWREMARIIGEVRPRFAFVENSPMLTFGGLAEFSGTWPRWGLMLDGEFWELPTLARPTSESASGFWPTPTAVTATGGAALCKWGGTGARAKLRTMVTPKELNGPLNPEWVSWLMGWPKGWSSSLRLETAKFQQWCAKPGGF